MSAFREKLSQNKTKSILCVGLDPRVSVSDKNNVYKNIVTQNKRIIDATHDVCACYKPNIAFYECWGTEGIDALKKTLSFIPPTIPVILDAKRGDIGSTAEAYAYSVFEYLQVDAVTLSPYMGKDSITPFLEYDAFVFILVRTSNPSSDFIQKVPVSSPLAQINMLYQHIAQESATWASKENLGFVVGANEIEALTYIRKTHPDRLILAPGIGAQGGTIETCMQHGASINENNNILPVVARSIAQSNDPHGLAVCYNEEAQQSFEAMQQKMHITATHNEHVEEQKKVNYAHSYIDVIRALFQNSCIKTGTFTLKSGATSPFYIDLRRIISFPSMMKRVVELYAELSSGISFDCIAGIPTAGLPFATALSYYLDVPMIYPRIPPKAHGMGNNVEGNYEKGYTALLLDDLITHGVSKQEAVMVLRDSDIIVRDLAVLINRSQTAYDEMVNIDITLHYAFDIYDIIDCGRSEGYISLEKQSEIYTFLRQ